MKHMSLLLIVVAYAVTTTPASAKIFNVMNFGAIANGRGDSTKAFLSAWKQACAVKGKPQILIPHGTFLIGPLAFEGPCRGFITMQIKGVLKAQTDLGAYDSDQWVLFNQVNDLIITGGGVFDGQGASTWPLNECSKAKDCKLLPTSIKFNCVTNATIRHIQSLNSKSFHINIDGSRDIKIHNVRITAPGNSPNTDGIHIGGSTNVRISHSFIGTGDDCISLGPGSVNVGISNVSCGPGHGISIGSLGRYANEAAVQGVKVRNCTLTGTTNGLRIKTWQASPVSLASNFIFENVRMNNVLNPIIIDQEYCPYTYCADKTPSKVRISNIKFHRIRGTSASQVAVKLQCSRAEPCRNVELSDIHLVYSRQGVAASSSCSNVQGFSKGHVLPPPCI